MRTVFWESSHFFAPSFESHQEALTGRVKILLSGGGGALEPPQTQGGGGAKRGSKGHRLISSAQMPENFGSNLLMGGGRDVLERLTTKGAPPSLE